MGPIQKAHDNRCFELKRYFLRLFIIFNRFCNILYIVYRLTDALPNFNIFSEVLGCDKLVTMDTFGVKIASDERFLVGTLQYNIDKLKSILRTRHLDSGKAKSVAAPLKILRMGEQSGREMSIIFVTSGNSCPSMILLQHNKRKKNCFLRATAFLSCPPPAPLE